MRVVLTRVQLNSRDMFTNESVFDELTTRLFSCDDLRQKLLFMVVFLTIQSISVVLSTLEFSSKLLRRIESIFVELIQIELIRLEFTNLQPVSFD